jgi:hypothetical protein
MIVDNNLPSPIVSSIVFEQEFSLFHYFSSLYLNGRCYGSRGAPFQWGRRHRGGGGGGNRGRTRICIHLPDVCHAGLNDSRESHQCFASRSSNLRTILQHHSFFGMCGKIVVFCSVSICMVVLCRYHAFVHKMVTFCFDLVHHQSSTLLMDGVVLASHTQVKHYPLI